MSSDAVIVLAEGFLLGLVLIVGLGPQNTFILQQGMKQRFVLMIALVASLIDGGLILLGVGGASKFFSSSPLLTQSIMGLGIVFLFAYGWKSFRTALRPEGSQTFKASKDKASRDKANKDCLKKGQILFNNAKDLAHSRASNSSLNSSELAALSAGANRKSVLFSCLAVSLLNPSAYLDTMLVIGGSAAHYASSLKLFFVIGAALASSVWFFSLAFGSAKLSGFLKRCIVLRLIDAFSGVIMWFIASRLVLHVFA